MQGKPGSKWDEGELFEFFALTHDKTLAELEDLTPLILQWWAQRDTAFSSAGAQAKPPQLEDPDTYLQRRRHEHLKTVLAHPVGKFLDADERFHSARRTFAN